MALTRLLAGRNAEVLALSESSQDERLQDLALVARIQEHETVELAKLPWLQLAPYANLEIGRLFCRAFVVLELSTTQASGLGEQLRELSRVLESAPKSAAPETRSRRAGSWG